MLCHFKFDAFLFYAGWIFVMTLLVLLFVPETKGIPLASMYQAWEGHWYQRRFEKFGLLKGNGSELGMDFQ
ncbi:hypothetical protein RHMOL_Rhmol10G0129800 [Rhododendron molle]|uniref:Uncharacterized protein n=1 Tax=Rhododendron molle TaxID=49168 RepID=A0ACC0M392_RHOML|nr:hypothetical protein RHMOL_Rhmol10G0129800 [Rhododendron molle]